MIRYSAITILLLLAAFIIQQFLPAFTGLYDSRILFVQLVFLCCAVTISSPTMLLLAFIGGFFWDAQCALGPHGGDPEVYTQQVESLRFGYSILLFGGMGFLMQGLQPLFKQGKWQFSAMLSGVAVLLYLAVEYAIINFIRGDLILTKSTVMQMVYTAILTMLISPVVFGLLFFIAKKCQHSINPEADRRNRRRRAY
jgi:cell shape-determining protein MreD